MSQRKKEREKYMVIMVLTVHLDLDQIGVIHLMLEYFARMIYQIMLQILNGQIIQIQLEIYYVVEINWIKQII